MYGFCTKTQFSSWKLDTSSLHERSLNVILSSAVQSDPNPVQSDSKSGLEETIRIGVWFGFQTVAFDRIRISTAYPIWSENWKSRYHPLMSVWKTEKILSKS